MWPWTPETPLWEHSVSVVVGMIVELETYLFHHSRSFTGAFCAPVAVSVSKKSVTNS